jgi:superfamily I DNA/RNA helicase
MAPFKATFYQKAIHEFMQACKGNLIIEAGAGTGKTTTLVEGIKLIPPNRRVLVTSFQTAIVSVINEACAGLENVDVKGTHQLGYDLNTRNLFCFRRAQRYAGQDRIKEIIKELGKNGKDDYHEWVDSDEITYQLFCLTNWVKETNPFFSNFEEVLKCAPKFLEDYIPPELDACECFQFGAEIVYRGILDLITQAKEKKIKLVFDFADMLFLPLRLNLIKPLYDNLIIDEAQDMNKAQLELIQRLLKKKGCLVACGDSYQGIHVWRGAEIGALKQMAEDYKATVLRLPESFRVPQSGVRHAQEYNPHFLARPENKEGVVNEGVTLEEMRIGIKPGDALLSRINGPLVRHALRFGAQGIPNFIQGIGLDKKFLGILWAIERSGPFSSLEDMAARILDWKTRLQATASNIKNAEKREEAIQEIQDKYDVFELVLKEASDPKDVKKRIKKLFPNTTKLDPAKHIVLSSVHRSKGLEWNTVWILMNKMNKKTEEESNLCYVGFTRHKETLNKIV